MISLPVSEKIRQALVMKDWEGIGSIVTDSSCFKEKKARALVQMTINSVIVEFAFQNNTPESLVAIRTYSTGKR